MFLLVAMWVPVAVVVMAVVDANIRFPVTLLLLSLLLLQLFF